MTFIKRLVELETRHNKNVSDMIKIGTFLEHLIQYVAPPTQFNKPEIYPQFESLRLVSIKLFEWEMEAICGFITDISIFLNEEPEKLSDTCYRFKEFDVDFYLAKGCYYKPTGKVIETRTEETKLVCV